PNITHNKPNYKVTPSNVQSPSKINSTGKQTEITSPIKPMSPPKELIPDYLSPIKKPLILKSASTPKNTEGTKNSPKILLPPRDTPTPLYYKS
ncbi:hypothetical protein, partial [Salmonella sp. s51228]|uniref:hypothetical protein n=1 Tax=Salmonella sp. s51228 TaxID=3159652 RepID=UPI00397F2289